MNPFRLNWVFDLDSFFQLCVVHPPFPEATVLQVCTCNLLYGVFTPNPKGSCEGRPFFGSEMKVHSVFFAAPICTEEFVGFFLKRVRSKTSNLAEKGWGRHHL